MVSSQSTSPTIEYDAFLFDLDGTLLDTADDLGAALNTVLRSQQLDTVSREIYRAAASNGAAALLEVGFKDKWGEQPQAQLVKQLIDAYAANIAKHTPRALLVLSHYLSNWSEKTSNGGS